MTRRAAFAVAAAVLVAASTVAPANAVAASRDRFAVGDSVMLGARSALRDSGFGVNAAVSRQAYSGPALLRQKGGELPANVVIHLGTNGTFPLSTCRRLVRIAGPERRVFLVTVHVKRPWAKSNNAMMRKCDASFADDRVHVIDWDREASRHPWWLYSDGAHLRPSGAAAFTRLLDSSVDDAIAKARYQTLAQASGTGKASVDG